MFDFHIHTTKSDGYQTPEEVVSMAVEEKLSAIAITDHNVILEEYPDLQKKYQDQIQLVNGVELSSIYQRSDTGEPLEVHIVALGFDSDRLRETVDTTCLDQRGYVQAMIEKLRECGIAVPDYDTLRDLYPEHEHMGRTQLADYMVKHGDAATEEEAMDEYVGIYGKRKAFVNEMEYSHYHSVEENVKAILDAGGIPVLAHLLTYRLPDEECLRLVKSFRELARDAPAGMEVYYRKYSADGQKKLAEIARAHGLLFSRASDYHGRKGHSLMTAEYPGWECSDKTVFDVLCSRNRAETARSI